MPNSIRGKYPVDDYQLSDEVMSMTASQLFDRIDSTAQEQIRLLLIRLLDARINENAPAVRLLEGAVVMAVIDSLSMSIALCESRKAQ